MIDINKARIQKESLATWKENLYNGTIVLSTGSGKTRVGVLAIKDLMDKMLIGSCLIIVPTTNLRDNEWANEIELWAPEIRSIVEIECIQTTYKWEDRFYDLVIVDEIHTTLSPEHRKFYFNNRYTYLLGLTATPPEEKEYFEILEELCPIIYKLHLNEAVKLNLVTDYTIFNIPVRFTQKERVKYNTYTSMYLEAVHTIGGNGESVFEICTKAKDDKYHKFHKLAKKFWFGMTARRWLCYKAFHKIQASIDIIESFSNKKWIIFCQHTDFADQLQDELLNRGIMAVSYHSKMKAKNRKEALETAKSPLCRVICSAVALNTGYNLPVIDAAICAASDSSKLKAIQSMGRISRKDITQPNKKALFINLYVENTQEAKWVDNKNKGLRGRDINSVSELRRLIHGR